MSRLNRFPWGGKKIMRRTPARRQNIYFAGPALFVAGIAIASCATESTLGPIGTPPTADGQSQLSATSGGQTTDVDCPTVTIRTGASAWQIPSGQGPTNVRYQGSLGQLARECAILGETMTMRVGVEGRLLVGPKGGPGSVNVPIRIALVAEGPQPRPVWSKFYSVPVQVPPGASQAVFSQVEDDLTFPLPADRRMDNYIVYVGFDPTGAPAAKSAPKAAPKPKPAAPKTTSAPAAAPPPQPAAKQQQPRFEPTPQSSPPPGVFAPPPGH
jgi:hypothetical protein